MFFASFVTLASFMIARNNGQMNSTMPITATNYVCGGMTLSSSLNMAVYLKFDYSEEMVYITLEGPLQWFAVGYGNNVMSGTYITGVDGDGTVSERKLPTGSRGPGTLLTPSVTKQTDVTTNDTRKVVLSRNIVGVNDDYFTFGTYNTNNELQLIYSTADTNGISQHSSQDKGNPKISNFIVTTNGNIMRCGGDEPDPTNPVDTTDVGGDDSGDDSGDDDDDDSESNKLLNINYFVMFFGLILFFLFDF